jgi:hypothetical protein
LRDSRTYRIDLPYHFVTGYARILQPRPMTFLHQRIAVTNATSFDFHPNPAGFGLGNFAFYNFQRSSRSCDLRNTHHIHSAPIESHTRHDGNA